MRICCHVSCALLLLSVVLLRPPDSRAERPRAVDPSSLAPPSPAPWSHPALIASGAETLWVNVHTTGACPGAPSRGGEATGGPGAAETWCFEGGAHDTISVGPLGAGTHTYRWTHADRSMLRDDYDSLYWHCDTFQTVSTRSMWCGGFNDRCSSWGLTTGGYGNFWNQIMQVNVPGSFVVTNGCSLQFKARYALECDYDFSFLEFFSHRDQKWHLVDEFNGKSGCTVVSPKTCLADWNNYRSHTLCPSLPYGSVASYPGSFSAGVRDSTHLYTYANGFVVIRGDSITATPGVPTSVRLRWRFTSDPLKSAQDGTSALRGWWIDDVIVKAAGAVRLSENFDAVPVGGRPGVPWTYPHNDSLFDGWALRWDLDPPLEGSFFPGPGDSGVAGTCEINASWQWSITPSGETIPPYQASYPGLRSMLVSPSIPLDYSENGLGPFAKATAIWQWSFFLNTPYGTCDLLYPMIQVHKVSTPGWGAAGSWCPWRLAHAYPIFDDGSVWHLEMPSNVSVQTAYAGLDSCRFGWLFADVGYAGDGCWDPTLPPHLETQLVVDNVSVGIIDGSATRIGAWRPFQDTFNLQTCLHSIVVATGDLGDSLYPLRSPAESLFIDVRDPDGITAGNVKLWYSLAPDTSSWSSVPLHFSQPDPVDPTTGGRFFGTVCPTPVWNPGTRIVYYLTVTDNLGNVAYFPSASNPAHQYYPLFFDVDVLPTPGSKILLVDGTGAQWGDFSPCRRETTLHRIRDDYGQVLEALGFEYMKLGGYDRYDVGQADGEPVPGTEPWGFWGAVPSSPDSGFRRYDVVIWSTGPRHLGGALNDTTQTFLKHFVFHGGKLLVSGDGVGDALIAGAMPQDPDFYGPLLGARYVSPHASGFLSPHRRAKVPAIPRGPTLVPGDSIDIYSGCNYARVPMDKIRLETTSLPAWSHPQPYLLYDDRSAPYDSVAAIYNFVTFTADTGEVVYLPFSLDAVTNQATVTCLAPDPCGPGTFQGRSQLLMDILGLFDATLSPSSGVARPAEAFVDALLPAQPSPFSTGTSIRFSLADRQHVQLVIYDVSGRRVRTLLDESRVAGSHQVRWDGSNDAHQAVAQGLYFVHLHTERFTATGKLALIR